MIHSKPKGNTVFALFAFFIILLCGIFYTNHHASENGMEWYHIVSLIFAVAIAVIILVMLMFRVKVISIDKGVMKISYPLRFRKSEMQMREQLFSWQEELIQTNKTTFKELTILFKDGDVVTLSNQEDSGYKKIHHYLTQKYKKEKKDPKVKK